MFEDIVAGYNRIEHDYKARASGAKDVCAAVFFEFHPVNEGFTSIPRDDEGWRVNPPYKHISVVLKSLQAKENNIDLKIMLRVKVSALRFERQFMFYSSRKMTSLP